MHNLGTLLHARLNMSSLLMQVAWLPTKSHALCMSSHIASIFTLLRMRSIILMLNKQFNSEGGVELELANYKTCKLSYLFSLSGLVPLVMGAADCLHSHDKFNTHSSTIVALRKGSLASKIQLLAQIVTVGLKLTEKTSLNHPKYPRSPRLKVHLSTAPSLRWRVPFRPRNYWQWCHAAEIRTYVRWRHLRTVGLTAEFTASKQVMSTSKGHGYLSLILLSLGGQRVL